MADAVAVRAAFRPVLRAELRVLLAALRAWLLWRVDAAFLPDARFCTCVWLLRALVLRARELLALELRVLLDRVVVLRGLLLRRVFWVVAFVLLLL